MLQADIGGKLLRKPMRRQGLSGLTESHSWKIHRRTLVSALQRLGSVIAANQIPVCTEQTVDFLPEGPIDVLEPNFDTPNAATAVLGLRPEALLTEPGRLPPGRQLAAQLAPRRSDSLWITHVHPASRKHQSPPAIEVHPWLDASAVKAL